MYDFKIRKALTFVRNIELEVDNNKRNRTTL